MGQTIAPLEALRAYVAKLDKQIVDCSEAIEMNPPSVNLESHKTACKHLNDCCVRRSSALWEIGRLALK